MSLIYFFMGIGLSMDAFSLALSLGTTNPENNKVLKTSILVGIFHYIMPTIGYLIGINIKNIVIGINYLTSIIFLVLAYELYRNKDKKENKFLTYITILIISFSVSIDSLTVGIVLGLNNEFIKVASIIFSITSIVFTYLGFILGKKLNNKFQNKAIYIGIILLLIVSIKYLISV